jgi:hypothetical protein
MGKDDLIGLEADLNNQMALIQAVAQTLEERLQGEWHDDPVRMESIAYQIHNLYNAVEDLLKFVAAHFENNIVDASRWHTELLRRMSRELSGIRPALLSQECYLLINGIRGFRHFFRHAYNVPIDPDLLQVNLSKARRIYLCLVQDVDRFLQQLKDEN